MKKFSFISLLVLSLIIVVISCKKEEEDPPALPNTFTPILSGTESSITEGSGEELVAGLNFSTALQSGVVTFSIVETDVSYGTVYETSPAAINNMIEMPYDAGDKQVSFTVSVIDDAILQGNGSLLLSYESVESEEVFNDFTYSYTLHIIDDEVPQINPSSDTVEVPAAKVGESGDPVEYTFEKLNLSVDVSAEASAGFSVSDAADGTYASTATLSGTSVFVQFAAESSDPLGEVEGVLTLTASGAEDVEVVLTSEVLDGGTLYMAEYFATAAYDDAEHYIGVNPVFFGWPTNEFFPTDSMNMWVAAQNITRFMKGGALSVSGYPGPIDGTSVNSLISSEDQGNNWVKNDCSLKYSKNVITARRFAQEGEITSGKILLGALVKVTEALPEAELIESMAYGFGKFHTNGSANVHIKSDAGGGFHFGFGKNTDGSLSEGVCSTVGTAFTTETYVVGETYAVILEYEFVDGALNDKMSLYVFAAADNVDGYADLTPVIVKEDWADDGSPDLDPSEAGMNGFTQVWIREKADKAQNGNSFQMTGIRVSSTLPSLFGNNPLTDSNPIGINAEKFVEPGCVAGLPADWY